jgi:hypothetical protein
MRKVKRLAAIMLLALVASLYAPQAFAGDMATGITGDMGAPGIAGDMHTPGVTGDIQAPGVNGDMQTPGLNGEILTPPGFDGWIGTGLAAIAALFG